MQYKEVQATVHTTFHPISDIFEEIDFKNFSMLRDNLLSYFFFSLSIYSSSAMINVAQAMLKYFSSEDFNCCLRDVLWISCWLKMFFCGLVENILRVVKITGIFQHSSS